MRARLLFLDSYTVPAAGSVASTASDEIGYGITAVRALKTELRRLGYHVDELLPPPKRPASRDERLAWIYASYQALLERDLRRYDVIFFFHVFHQFPVEVRRALLDRGARHVKLVGYTHGSHWDPSDLYRQIVHPGLEVADLANLHALDAVLLVSEHLRAVLTANVARVSPALAAELAPRLHVVGLPIDAHALDARRAVRNGGEPGLLFNHAPLMSKHPEVFFRLAAQVLERVPARVVVTRRFERQSPGYSELLALRERYGARVVLGNTLPIDEYFRALWQTDIQVSTASHETLGVATLEAMYTENCCLLPNHSSYPELAGDVPGVLYADEGELAERLMYFAETPGERRLRAADLRKRCERYLPAAVSDNIHGVLEGVLGAR